nr:hypothetical protein CFP56_18897 [Quercus suber]
MQYRARLRGDPWRNNGWDLAQGGSGKGFVARSTPAGDFLKKQSELTGTEDIGDRKEGDHVQLIPNIKQNISMGESSLSEEQRGLKEVEMQWEAFEAPKGEPKIEFNQAPSSPATVAEVKEGESKLELDPLAMTYDPIVGWVTEKLGPSSKHWKRLARGEKSSESVISLSPIKQKREGPTPLSELDPNVLELKRRRGNERRNKE